MTSIDHNTAMSEAQNGEERALKPWATPKVIVSVMQNSENNNNGNNSDVTSTGIPFGNS